MARINFEGYVQYLHTFCGVKNARELACKIFSENYPAQQITFTPIRTIEIEDCDYNHTLECWVPSGRIEKLIF
jgi:hypothetical protein